MSYAFSKILAYPRRSHLAFPLGLMVLWSTIALLLSAPAYTEGSEMSPRSVAEQHIANRRQNAAQRREEKGLKSLRSREGVTTLTNRGEKYDRKKGYEEVKIDLDPIYIDPKWRKPTRKRASMTYGSEEIMEFITEQSRLYNVDEKLISAVIKVESNWVPTAVSSAGASGLMQLMPGTAEDMGVSDIFDPYENIAGGTQYLSRMLEMFNNDTTLALAAYNAGPGNVLKYGGIPPFQETQDYVVKVQQLAGGTVSVPRTISPYSTKYAKNGSVSRGRTAKPETAPSRSGPGQPATDHLYLIKFHSGISQPADDVEDMDPHYRVVYGRRSYLVYKHLVKEIVKRSV